MTWVRHWTALYRSLLDTITGQIIAKILHKKRRKTVTMLMSCLQSSTDHMPQRVFLSKGDSHQLLCSHLKLTETERNRHALIMRDFPDNSGCTAAAAMVAAAEEQQELNCQDKGLSIYDVHKKSGFLTPFPLSTCVGPPPPCGRPHTVDMKYRALS